MTLSNLALHEDIVPSELFLSFKLCKSSLGETVQYANQHG